MGAGAALDALRKWAARANTGGELEGFKQRGSWGVALENVQDFH